MTNQQTLINNIILLRKSNNMTEQRIAQRLQISVGSYRLIEQGIKDLEVGQLISLARLFKLTLNDFLSEKLTHRLSVILSNREKRENLAIKRRERGEKLAIVRNIRTDIRSEMKHLKFSKEPNDKFY